MNKQLIEKLINYLAAKPYVEVYQLIGELMMEKNKQEAGEKKDD